MMKTITRDLLMEQLADEFWLLKFEFDDCFISKLSDIEIVSIVGGISQVKKLRYPDFLTSKAQIAILGTGIVIDLSQVRAVYLHRGTKYDLTLRFMFQKPGVELFFNFNLEHASPLDGLLESVISTHTKVKTKNPAINELTCPCCLKKQKMIRKHP